MRSRVSEGVSGGFSGFSIVLEGFRCPQEYSRGLQEHFGGMSACFREFSVGSRALQKVLV